MKLIWHIFRKDARCLCWPLVVWLVLRVAQMAMALVSPDDGVGMASIAGVAGWIGNLVLPIISYMLVMSIVQDDPVAADVSFWITRPIAGARLMAAKLLGIVLLLWALPVIVSLPWWLWHGYGPWELGMASLSVVKWQAIITLAALPIAALSEKSGKFLLITMGGLLLMALGEIAVSVAAGGTRPPSGVIESRGWLVFGIVLAAITSVTIQQFITRRTSRSWVMVAGALVAVFAVLLFWRWDFYSQFEWRDAPASHAMLKPRLKSAKLVHNRPLARNSRPKIVNSSLLVEYDLGGLPAYDVAIVQSSKQSLHWPDRTVPADNRGGVRIGAAVTREVGAEALAFATGKPAPTTQSRYATFELNDPMVTERLARESPSYQCMIAGQIWRPEIMIELPLRVGASFASRGFGVEIEAVESNNDVQAVWLREHAPEFVTNDAPITMPTLAGNFRRAPMAYFIINRHKPGVLFATPGRREDIASVATVRRFRQQLTFTSMSRAQAPAPDDLELWLKEAVLIKIVYSLEGPFHCTIETSHLEVEATPIPKS